MSLSAAVVIAGIALGGGIAVGMTAMFYFLYRIFGVLAAAMTGDPNVLRRALPSRRAPKTPADARVVPPMPDIGLETMQENSETMEKLRQKQDSTDSSSGNY